ncbi:MAG TPA: PEGA domain-containing protein [Gemmatimonadales bacterium]|jgi:hypothetical protein
MTPQQLEKPLPRVLDDEWEAPPRPSRLRRTIVSTSIGIALIAACVALLTRRDQVWEPAGEVGWVPPGATGPVSDPATLPLLSHDDVWKPDALESLPPASKSLQPPHQPAAQPAVPRPRPRPPALAGYLSINSTPWAELSVDGRVVGSTPQIRIRVAPGRHHLVLVREGFQTHSAWVDVAAGGTVRVTDITLKEITP